MRVWGKDKGRISSQFVGKLIRFQHESQPNSTHCSRQWALLSHVPRYLQVTAEERISIWSLMLDQERKHTKEVFVPARGFLCNKGVDWKMAHIILGEFPCCQCAPRVFYKLLFMKGNWRPHNSKTEQTVIGAASIWYWTFNRRSLMRCHLKSLSIPGI